MTVPQILHQIWLGPNPPPSEWIGVWREMYADWTYVLWREDHADRLFEGVSHPAVEAKFRDYQARGHWHGAANVLRAEILLRHGGVYVDVDSRPLVPFTGAAFMDASVFAAYEPNVPDLPGRVANGTIGAETNAPAMATWVRAIAELDAVEPSWDTTGGTSLTAALLLHRRCCDIRVMPPRVFYPRDPHGRLAHGTEDPYTDHFWATTNASYPVPA